MDQPLDGAFDAHVHLMPERLMGAIRDALHEQAGWSFPHPVGRDRQERVLREHGVARYVALPYAHQAGIARDLNEWLLQRADESAMCVPFATVHVEDDVRAVVREAFEAGARGLKFQNPVQGFAPDDPRLDPAYELAAEYDRPVLTHAGNAPMFEDSSAVGVERFRAFVESFPEVRAACPHMGTFQWEAFVDLAYERENVFLDTSFAMADTEGTFDPSVVPDDVFEDLAGRVMYGSDFPNIPHAYEAEYRGLRERDLSAAAERALFSGAAERFLGER